MERMYGSLVRNESNFRKWNRVVRGNPVNFYSMGIALKLDARNRQFMSVQPWVCGNTG